MNIKFQKPLSDYKYILSFDLAKKLSGYSLLEVEDDNIILTGTIDTDNALKTDIIWSYFYTQVISVVDRVLEKIGYENQSSLLIVKEQLPVQNGRFSTITTLQALAQVHAIFDLAVHQQGIDVYDENGVHSVAVKAYFRKLLDIQSPQKEDIANYIYKRYKNYDFSSQPLDVTDSIAVTLTLIKKKWDSDIVAQIAAVKKEIKGAKAQNKIDKLKAEIERLEALKLEQD